MTTRGGTLLAAVVLLFALAPSVTYVGHWPLRVDIPFTNYYWGFPEAWGSHTHSSHGGEDHGSHCHGESSCTTKPVTSGAGFALVAETLLLLGAGALLLRLQTRERRLHAAGDPAPEPPPPRPARLAV
ncbi:MAG: hypothetical protein U5Q44_16735 [Dehalococcoidia bacterium]|nr:hypothetical protein [Dehalococcoidia bacterium]